MRPAQFSFMKPTWIICQASIALHANGNNNTFACAACDSACTMCVCVCEREERDIQQFTIIEQLNVCISYAHKYAHTRQPITQRTAHNNIFFMQPFWVRSPHFDRNLRSIRSLPPHIHYFYDSQSWHFFRNVCHRCATVLHREHVISFISVSFLYSRAIHEFCNRNSNTYRATRTPGTAFSPRAPRNAGTNNTHTHIQMDCETGKNGAVKHPGWK